MSDDSDYLMMSGIQHFSFCRRQWALDYSQYVEFKARLENLIDLKMDSLRFYCLGNKYQKKVEQVGKQPDIRQDDILIV